MRARARKGQRVTGMVRRMRGRAAFQIDDDDVGGTRYRNQLFPAGAAHHDLACRVDFGPGIRAYLAAREIHADMVAGMV